MYLIPGIEIVFNCTKDNSAIYSPLVSGIIGIVGVCFGYWLKEKNENNQEEYRILLTTKDLLDVDSIDKGAINEFYKNLRFDLRARRLDTYELIVSALLHAKEGKIDASEKDKIAARLNTLNKKRLITRIKSSINWGSSQ